MGEGKTRLLLGMGLASGITSVPNAAIVLALPTIHREFDASLTTLEWTVTGYLLAYSALLIAAGRLADIFGRVRLLVAGTLVYAGASVAAALAGSALVLIVGLAAVGVGGAVLTPASLAIVTESFRGTRRGMAVGVWGAATALFSGVGPAIGGLFTHELSWRWILWLNVVAGAFILLGVRGAPETQDLSAGRRVDLTGLLCSVAGLVAIVLALNEAPSPWPLSSPQVIGLLVGGALLLVAFIGVERHVRAPLIDPSILSGRNVSGAAIVVFVLNFPFGAVLFFLPLYLQELLHYDPLQAGLLLLPASATLALAMPVGGRLYERLGPLPPIVTGMVLSGTGMLLLSGIGPSTRYSDLWVPLALLGLGIGAALTPMNLCALNAVPRVRHGAVGGLITMLAGLGGAFGVAVSGAVFEQLQARRTIEQAAERGIHLTTSAVHGVEGLLAGTASATSALNAYPPARRAAVTAAVHDGFTSALSTTMLLSLGVVVLGVILTMILIRRRDPVEEAVPAPNVADPFAGAALRP